jgi:hypothetical protein
MELRCWYSRGTHELARTQIGKEYNRAMARGWESKSVESQQEEAAGRDKPGKPRLTREEAARKREEESLMLALKDTLEKLQHNQNPRYRNMLEGARSELERKIRDLTTRSDHQTGG